MDESLLRQAAIHGPEFVATVLEMEAVLQDIAEQMRTEAGMPDDVWDRGQD